VTGYAGRVGDASRHLDIPWKIIFSRQFYYALLMVNSMQVWTGWKLLPCRELESV
jgi:hypothetical protein